MPHSLKPETIRQIASDIISDLIENTDLEGELADFASDLTSDLIPYNTGSDNDAHAEISDVIMTELAKYLRKGYEIHKNQESLTSTVSQKNLKDFYGYVNSYYGPGGIYDMGATMDQIMEATAKHIKEPGISFEGDSVDRDAVCNIMIRDYGLTPQKVAHKTS